MFNANGGLRAAADSPLVQLQQHLWAQREVLERLQADETRGSGIQAQVLRLQDDRQRLLGEVESAEALRAAAIEQAEQARLRSTLKSEIDDLQTQLGQADALAAQLTLAEGRIAEARTDVSALKAAESSAQSSLEAIRGQLQPAAAAVARASEAAEQSERVKDAALAQRRAELEMARTAAAARLSEVATGEQAVGESTLLEQQLRDASDGRDLAARTVTDAERALEQATTSTALDELLGRETVAARAADQLSDAQRREQAARDQLDSVAAAVADAERRRDGGELELQSQEVKDAEAEMQLLHAVESHISIARLRADVRDLEEAAERARTLRASAQTRRSEASDVDLRVASKVLPTREQIAGDPTHGCGRNLITRDLLIVFGLSGALDKASNAKDLQQISDDFVATRPASATSTSRFVTS